MFPDIANSGYRNDVVIRAAIAPRIATTTATFRKLAAALDCAAVRIQRSEWRGRQSQSFRDRDYHGDRRQYNSRKRSAFPGVDGKVLFMVRSEIWMRIAVWSALLFKGSTGFLSTQEVFMSPQEVLEFAKSNQVKQLDLRFSRHPRLQHHVVLIPSPNSRRILPGWLWYGWIQHPRWAAINESDMLLIPDPSTCVHRSVL